MKKQPKYLTVIDKLTPIWFDWLGWFLALGLVGYLAEKTNVSSLKVLFGISYILFFTYITNAISKLMNLSILQSEMLNKVVTLLIALITMGLSTIVLQQAIKVLVANG